jgi:RNA polymerase sigma-70 factor, ECF subfamily
MSTGSTALRRSGADDALDDGVAAFDAIRSRLLAIAHRILGCSCDAEDVVQETWIRWQLCDRAMVVNPTAFLVTVTTRLALNVANMARVRHEAWVGARPADPLASGDDPTLDVELRLAMESAVTTLLDRLEPPERTAFVLHEAFDVPYPLIATMLETSHANARQLGSRARKRLVAGQCRAATHGDHRRLVSAVVGATQRGDISDVAHLLSEKTCFQCG